MFSYKNLIQANCQEEIFNRGVRLYLEGFVGKRKTLSLDYWFGYNVKDNYKNETYFVKIPLIHLASKNLNKENVKDIITNFVSCDCQYFLQEKQVCRHIAASFLDLNAVYTPETKSNTTSDLANSIFDQIEKVEEDRKYVELIFNFEKWLENPRLDIRNRIFSFLNTEYKLQTEQNIEFQKLIQNIKSLLTKYLTTWENEKKFIDICFYCYTSNFVFWGKILNSFLLKIEVDNLLKFIRKLYEYKNNNEVKKAIVFVSQFLTENLRVEVLQTINDELLNRPNLKFKEKIDIAIDFSNYDYIWTNKDNLDPSILLFLMEHRQDLVEEAEIVIIEQLKQWLILITSEDYSYIEDILNKWYEINKGCSYNMHILIDYIKIEYKKRRNLQKIINQYL